MQVVTGWEGAEFEKCNVRDIKVPYGVLGGVRLTIRIVPLYELSEIEAPVSFPIKPVRNTVELAAFL